jgi:ADP-ribosylglycohydrolase
MVSNIILSMDKASSIEKYRGCILGLAIGDALGAPVEFLDYSTIIRKFGVKGITSFEKWQRNSYGSFTDDTQMSIATILGFLKDSDNVQTSAYKEYLLWYESQINGVEQRAPGHTCMTALGSGDMGTIEKPINTSKGCGGIMRVAPAGLVAKPEAAFLIGAQLGAITHGHPSGYLSSGFLSSMISYIYDGNSLEEAIEKSRIILLKYENNGETLTAINAAINKAKSNIPTNQIIDTFGGGWTGESALAIALFCSLRYSKDWSAGVLAAVNHSGDSDSTGSIAGAILGTLLGINAIPTRWTEKVEKANYLESLSLKLCEKFCNNRIDKLEPLPKLFSCPICDKRLGIKREGTFRCPSCKTIFKVNTSNTIVLI